MPDAKDPRWVILVETGDYSILGRHREPEPNDIAAAESSLTRLGLAGWLAVMSHSAHDPGSPNFLMVQPLRQPTISFDLAVQAFRNRHR